MSHSLKKSRTLIIALLLLTLSAGVVHARLVSDDFEDGSEHNWERGANVASGGPAGADDNYLRLTADGTTANGKIVTFNRAQWSGDYGVGGITTIAVDLACLTCSGPLTMRVAIGNGNSPSTPGTSTWWASTTGFTLPNDGQWHRHTFTIAETEMTRVQGSATFAAVFNNVTTLRLLHSASPSARGDDVTATVGVDNILGDDPLAVGLQQMTAGGSHLFLLTVPVFGLLLLATHAAKRRTLARTTL